MKISSIYFDKESSITTTRLSSFIPFLDWLFCDNSSPQRMPKLFINRRLAAEHTADPSQDPEAKHSLFHQVRTYVCM